MLSIGSFGWRVIAPIEWFFSSQEPKAQGELIVWDSSRRPCVRPSVRPHFQWGKPCDHSSSFIFDWNFLILAVNKDNHKFSDGFEIQQDPTRDL